MTMKRILTLILGLAAVMAASAQPSVRWLETTHNFGAFDEDMGPVSCDFVFVNDGTEPVSITIARASCGCTAPRYSTASVAPGDSGTVSVTYDPAGRPGRFDKFVAVDFSYPSSRVKLHVVGTVVGAASSVAQRFPAPCGEALQLAKGAVMIGDVAKGQLRTVFLSGYNRSSDTIRPSAVSLPPYIDMSIEPREVPPGEQTSFIFYFRSDRCPLYGLVSDSVSISPDTGVGPCTLPVVAVVREDFSRLTPGELAKAPVARLSVPSLDFGRISRDGEPVSMTATLHNDGKRTLEVRRIYTGDAGVSVSIDRTSIKKGKSAQITVTAEPSALPGAMLNARISVITNDPANAVRTLRAVSELR